MQKLTLKILTLTLAFFATACSNFGGKASYISSFEQFVNTVSEKQDSYTDEQWEQADLKFKKFTDTDYQKYSRKLTKEEKQKIGKLKGQYYAIRVKSQVGNFMNNIDDALEQFSGMVEGFMEEFDAEEVENINN